MSFIDRGIARQERVRVPCLACCRLGLFGLSKETA